MTSLGFHLKLSKLVYVFRIIETRVGNVCDLPFARVMIIKSRHTRMPMQSLDIFLDD